MQPQEPLPRASRPLVDSPATPDHTNVAGQFCLPKASNRIVPNLEEYLEESSRQQPYWVEHRLVCSIAGGLMSGVFVLMVGFVVGAFVGNWMGLRVSFPAVAFLLFLALVTLATLATPLFAIYVFWRWLEPEQDDPSSKWMLLLVLLAMPTLVGLCAFNGGLNSTGGSL